MMNHIVAVFGLICADSLIVQPVSVIHKTVLFFTVGTTNYNYSCIRVGQEGSLISEVYKWC